MFDQIGRYAETVAASASLSRRGFLDRVGQAALATAGVLGTLLVLPNKAHAGKCDAYECGYQCRTPQKVEKVIYNQCGGCPANPFPGFNCTLNYSHITGRCC
jgi:hypothetical protein